VLKRTWRQSTPCLYIHIIPHLVENIFHSFSELCYLLTTRDNKVEHSGWKQILNFMELG
jgi:hypothetical protein